MWVRVGEQRWPVQAGFSHHQVEGLLCRHIDWWLRCLTACPEQTAASATLPRGGVEQKLHQSERQTMDDLEWRRWWLEGAAAIYPIFALRKLGGCHDLAGRLQRAL